ncbi:EAL domain-containing protein [Candidatus Parabeggiatoa sp. HSG14]|uniref:EAL domain-containing protein n=1 Tax=Candidatus Parabeggiatoa sp. HSG14 TaxID=3055593 RepID=UPI0025A72F99|nr:EAL domain-containing protein [Thiotrichales bacterium HSG14]
MKSMHILLIEENANDYLNTRRLLDEQKSSLNIDWAPNCETAFKQLKQNHYDVCLVGYNGKLTEQQRFLKWLYKGTTIPTILLTKDDESVDSVLMEKYQIDFLGKEQLNWHLLKCSIRYLSKLITLQNKEKKFQAIFNNAYQFMGLLKADGIWLDINQTALTFMDSKREAVVGYSFLDMPWVMRSPKIKEQFKAAINEAGKGEFTRCEVEVKKQDEQQTTLDFTFTPLANATNEMNWILVEGRDLCDQNALEQQLNHSTLHDQLTGLPNRLMFMEHLEKALVHAQQHKDCHIAVLLLDLDRFKVVNTSLGHDMGDWLLMKIAQCLQECLDKENILARSGGDEFMVLLENMQDLVEATRLAVKINEVLAGPFSLDGYDLVMSASIGIAYHTEQYEATDLLRDADTAMYRAKARGKSCYAVFSSGMHDQAISRLQIETDLHKAIEKEDFFLFYQPQTELSTEQLVGTESLIRFCNPQDGLVLSVDFKQVLEDTGIIITIGEWILQTACNQLKNWLNAGLSVNHVAVNLSAHQFRSKRLTDVVAESIENSGLAPECLELELTESVLLEDIDSTIKTLKRFKNMGIRVTIDDFGTGYASLNYLKRFPADCLKINHSFIKGIISSPEDAAITVSTIDMAHALGLTVIAEGVENTEQRDFLRDYGCDFAQGDLYSAPMENSAFLEWGREYSQRLTA